MAKTDPSPVDAYIAAQPAATRRVLEKVRAILRKALPGAEEVISYKIPAYRLHGGIVVYFAGWKQHYALYPVTAPLIAAFKDDLAPYELSHKGTVRFRLDAPVPVRLIARIAKYRAQEVAERKQTKAAMAKKTPTAKRTKRAPAARKKR
jgi:uncharacterized protein YdhG (YjbR/CyaY superfamily)